MMKQKYFPLDPVFIVDNVGLVIEPATIKEIDNRFPGYYLVATDRGAEIKLGEDQIFSTKKEAVKEILVAEILHIQNEHAPLDEYLLLELVVEVIYIEEMLIESSSVNVRSI